MRSGQNGCLGKGLRVGGPGTPPFGARGRSSVRYGTRLGDLKNKHSTHTLPEKRSGTRSIRLHQAWPGTRATPIEGLARWRWLAGLSASLHDWSSDRGFYNHRVTDQPGRSEWRRPERQMTGPGGGSLAAEGRRRRPSCRRPRWRTGMAQLGGWTDVGRTQRGLAGARRCAANRGMVGTGVRSPMQSSSLSARARPAKNPTAHFPSYCTSFSFSLGPGKSEQPPGPYSGGG